MAQEVALETEIAPGSLGRGAAAIAGATAVSRVTGFVRVAVLAAVAGGTFLVNTYQTANTAPNVLFELVAAGVLTSVFVPLFVEYLVERRSSESWEAANALTSVTVVALVGLAAALALSAPLIMRLLTLGVRDPELRSEEIQLGTALLRLFSPQVVFYGVGMIMTGALHAHRRFGLPAVAPIFNNVVVIGVYAAYAASRGDRPADVGTITAGETLLLGLGTTAGVVAMTVCLVPPLTRLGWRFRWRFDLSHPAVKRAWKMGVWTLGYAGGYQAGLIVVLILANEIRGGVAAYQWAYVFFYVPHALFAAPIFHVLFPAMSEDVARGESESLRTRLQSGLGMLGFVLIPIAALMLVTSEIVARLTLEYGVMSAADAGLVGRVMAAFAIGLPAYSAFLVLTRAFYAMGDARTPAIVNGGAIVVSSASAALLFFVASDAWAVPGLALGHTIGFTVGTAGLLWVLARKGLSPLGRSTVAALVRSTAAAVLAGIAMAGTRALLPEATKLQELVALAVVALIGAVVYVAAMVVVGSSELTRLVDLAFGRPSPALIVKGKVLQVMGPSAGGIGRHVALVTEGLDGRQGLVVDIAAPPDVPVMMPKEVHPLWIPSGPLLGHRKAVAAIRAIVTEGGYELVHAHGLRAGIDSALAVRGSDRRVILTVHNLVMPEIAGRLKALVYRWAEPLAVRLSARTFGASKQISRHLAEIAKGSAPKIETLHAPVGDPPPVSRSKEEARAELGARPEERLVVTAARLAPQKALEVMLEAVAALPDDVVLVIVGEGPLRGDLESRAAELGLSRRVKFTGFRSDAADFIAAADVFCLSSVWEAVALAAQEAVLLGTPVVSTDVGGMSELIRDGYSGRLVAKGDADELASALKEVLDSPEVGSIYAARALEDLRNRFSREKMLDRLAREYRGDQSA
ncbi:MAG: murein biosynthesis integral membrane protein MurJ [Actinomycetota bacterium]|nr:murein biosynthesis integral membrane protein MurJ [Actinomycetota bacterium]